MKKTTLNALLRAADELRETTEIAARSDFKVAKELAALGRACDNYDRLRKGSHLGEASL